MMTDSIILMIVSDERQAKTFKFSRIALKEKTMNSSCEALFKANLFESLWSLFMFLSIH